MRIKIHQSICNTGSKQLWNNRGGRRVQGACLDHDSCSGNEEGPNVEMNDGEGHLGRRAGGGGAGVEE